MTDQDTPLSAEFDPKATDPPSLSDELYARYADDLKGTELSEAQQREFLLRINQIMQVIVDFGFSLAPGTTFSGDNRSAEGDLGFDDVLDFLFMDSAPRRDARICQKSNKDNQEQE